MGALSITEMVTDALLDQARGSEENPAVMPTGCVVIVEMLHEDGLRYLHMMRPDETTLWEAVGMVEIVKHTWVQEIDNHAS